MYALDFIYDNIQLSDKGFIICNFDGQTGTSIGIPGYNITFDKVARDRGRTYDLTGTQYMECLTTTFDICKDPELNDYDEMEISSSEYREMARWLNRNEFLEFRPIYESNDLMHDSDYFLRASFNVSKVYVNSKLYGIRLVMETDSPFVYGTTEAKPWNISNPNGGLINFVDTSDEIGYHYFDSISIKCSAAGDLTISNAFTGTVTTIANCSANERITIYGSTKIITTDDPTHKVYNDFNFVFPMIGNSYSSNINAITFSLPCSITTIYTPLLKDIPD